MLAWGDGHTPMPAGYLSPARPMPKIPRVFGGHAKLDARLCRLKTSTHLSPHGTTLVSWPARPIPYLSSIDVLDVARKLVTLGYGLADAQRPSPQNRQRVSLSMFEQAFKNIDDVLWKE